MTVQTTTFYDNLKKDEESFEDDVPEIIFTKTNRANRLSSKRRNKDITGGYRRFFKKT